MISLQPRIAFSRHSRLLALALEALVLLSLLAGAIPLAPAQPVWWLRLSDATVNLAPLLLVAVMLLRLGVVLLDNDNDDAMLSGRRSFQLASRWGLVFALLVPLQIVGFAWLWSDSDSQINRQISQNEASITSLRGRIIASDSSSELRSLLGSTIPELLPTLTTASLVDQKQQLSESLNGSSSRLHSNLRQQRSDMLRGSLPGTLRVLFGAAIVASFLQLLRRQ